MENIKAINKIRIKRKEKQLLLRFVTGILIFSILLNVGIAALYPQVVYASFAGTVAGYILTLFASFNTAITNPNVVSAINNTFGNMALEAADAGVIDQGIAQIASTTGFNMAQIFSNTTAEAEQVVAAGWDTISTTAQTAGQNIAAGAAACAASAGAVLPAIGGAVLPAAGAVGAGVGLGIIIDKARTALTNYIKNGYKLDTKKQLIDRSVGSVFNVGFYNNNVPILVYSNVPNTYGCAFPISGGYKVGLMNFNSSAVTFYENYNGNTRPFSCSPRSTFLLTYTINPTNPSGGYIQFANEAEVNAYMSRVLNGNQAYPSTYSPDIIGNKGNQTGYLDNGNYNTPYIQNIYDYGNTVLNYINPTDYQTFVSDANNNTDTGDTGYDTQGETFKDFVDPYIKPVENTPINPDNPGEELPNPQPTISPTDPTIPIQPTAAPEPTLTPEETDEMPYGMTQPKLSDKFPFCIPFDIAYLFAILSDEREAPNFVWTLDLGTWGQYEIEIDLTPFDSVASIFRLCELILFIFGLMLITKSLMSSNDGG